MNRRIVGNIALLLFSCVLAIFLAEGAMESGLISIEPLTKSGTIDIDRLAERTAVLRGATYDSRSVYRVVAEQREKGVHAFPALSPAYYLADNGGSKIDIGNKAILPLGIAAMASTYYCNEGGQYAEFKTDRYGFRNPNALWDASQIDVMAVGDSFTFGSCLPERESIVGQIRAKFPRTLNFGIGANGPLIELATIREFVRSRKPETVLWFFFENDLEDLNRDAKNSILREYLKPEFSQNLEKQRLKVNAAVDAISEEYYGRIEAVEKAKVPPIPTPWYELPRIRSVLAFLKNGIGQTHEKVDLQLFKQVMTAAKNDVAQYGGKLYFVYLPDCADSYHRSDWRDDVLKMIRGLGLSVIDTLPAVAKVNGGAKNAYFYCPGSHFNQVGAKVAANMVLDAIKPEVTAAK